MSLCNTTIANTANQFRQYFFEVTSILASCGHSPALALNFGSAANIVLDIAKTGPADINSANGITGSEFQGKVYMRKEQNDFGWDWSPSLSPAGPWRPAYIVELLPNAPIYVRNSLIDIYREGQMNNLSPDQSKPFVFNASVDILGEMLTDAGLHLKLTDPDGQVVEDSHLTNVTKSNETITGSVNLEFSPKLWWPYGIGAQPLYNATISVINSENKTLTAFTKRVGFRTIVLSLSPISREQIAAGIAPGSNWHLEINGREFYAKGSNFVPPDTFWPRANSTKIKELFDLVISGNQNMLRVWSSGAYLADWIYDLADEMGILLWSEFEFSDAEYPSSPDYLAKYEAEAYYNVRRVNHHPSLALWAGGNELESILLALFFNASSPILQGYQRIFEESLIKCVYANSRSISYIPSSTYNGYLSLDFSSSRPQTPRYNNKSSPGALYSDTDNYNYDATQAFNLSSYPIGRFADEFGFISMPSLQSWQEALPADQLFVESAGVLHHNRHYPFGASGNDTILSAQGISQMTDAVKLWYPIPSLSDSTANFSAWIYSTQVFQAEYYASEIAFYRRGSALRERQLGCLYWQLEDLWVAPTWSSIEANGRPKILYYSAKDLYKPVIVYSYFDNATQTLEVWVTSDLWTSVSGTVSFEWIDWEGNAILVPPPNGTAVSGLHSNKSMSSEIPFSVGPINATRVLTYLHVPSLFTNHSASDALLRLSVQASSTSSNAMTATAALPPPQSSSDLYTHSSYFHPARLADSALRDPGLHLAHNNNDNSSSNTSSQPDKSQASVPTFTVTATRAVAAWVWLDHPASVRGYFEENGFWLMKGEEKTVRFVVWHDWTGDGSWMDGVTVRSMWNNTLAN
ncbi:MAG: hypothetical protein Q9227_007892 [Pyrenula ochraceoflavens]